MVVIISVVIVTVVVVLAYVKVRGIYYDVN